MDEGRKPGKATSKFDLESLRASLEMLRLVIDHTPNQIFWKDTESVYLGCNTEFARAAGIQNPDAIVGSTDSDLPWTQEETDFFLRWDRRVIEGDAPERHIIEPQTQFDGTRAWVDTTKIPLHDNTGHVIGVLGITGDITDRLRAERELQLEKKRFEQLFVNSPLAILMGDAEDRIVITNPSFRELFGFEDRDLIGLKVNEVITPAGLEDEASDLSQRVLAGDTVTMDTVRQRTDGTLVPVQIIGVPVVIDGTSEAVYGIYVDMTARRNAEQALRESEERFRSLAEQSLQGIFVINERRVLFVNPMLCVITGYSEDELLAMGTRRLMGLVHSGDRAFVRDNVRRVVIGEERRQSQSEYRVISKHDQMKWVLQQTRKIQFGGTPAVVGVVLDITKRKQAEEELLTAAIHDGLTGLPNRALFNDRVQVALERTRRHDDYAFAVLFLDLDRFKVVNDSLGHGRGDQLLIDIANRLKTVMRAGDTVARLGGDEFTVLVNDVEGADDAIVVAERIQNQLAAPFALDGHEVFTTVSSGIALSRGGYHSPDEIVRDADIAMYRAKEAGRARYMIFDPTMHTHAVALLRLETDLRLAVEREEFLLHYQPIVDLPTGRTVAVEALLRWQHPSRGLLPPAEFLPLAEETGLIFPMGEWVLSTACAQAACWHRESPDVPALAVSINLFSRQFSQPQLVDLIDRVLTETGLPASALQLEITEGTIIDSPERAVEVIGRLKALGIKVNLDDFGTGYSSLSYLQRFAVDALKIDRSFVGRIAGGSAGGELVEAIVALAHTLGMQALAEGVETPEQLSRLRTLGCEYGQGFYFSQPVEPGRIPELLARPIAPPSR